MAVPSVALAKDGVPSVALAKDGVPSVALAKDGVPSVALAKDGGRGGTRTLTVLRPLAPEASASTSSATRPYRKLKNEYALLARIWSN